MFPNIKKNFLSSLDKLFLYLLLKYCSVQFSSAQLFEIPWTAVCLASLSIANSWSLLKLSPLSRWCHPIISSSVVPFSSCLQILWSLLILSPSSSSSFLILLGKSYPHKWFQLSSINWCIKGFYFYSWSGPIYTTVWRNLYWHVPKIPSMHHAQTEFTTISKPAPPPGSFSQ